MTFLMLCNPPRKLGCTSKQGTTEDLYRYNLFTYNVGPFLSEVH